MFIPWDDKFDDYSKVSPGKWPRRKIQLEKYLQVRALLTPFSLLQLNFCPGKGTIDHPTAMQTYANLKSLCMVMIVTTIKEHEPLQ